VSGAIADNVSFPAGSSVTYSLTGRIDIRFGGTLSNTASATSSVGDPNPADDSATDQTDVSPLAPVSSPALGVWGLCFAAVTVKGSLKGDQTIDSSDAT
jgi:hypothetical protein